MLAIAELYTRADGGYGGCAVEKLFRVMRYKPRVNDVVTST